MHLPLIVRGPGIGHGSKATELAGNIDLAPTFADLAGAKVPDFVDGRSLVPILKGQKPADWREVFLVEHWAGAKGNGAGAKGKVSQSNAICETSDACVHCAHASTCYCDHCGNKHRATITADHRASKPTEIITADQRDSAPGNHFISAVWSADRTDPNSILADVQEESEERSDQSTQMPEKDSSEAAARPRAKRRGPKALGLSEFIL